MKKTWIMIIAGAVGLLFVLAAFLLPIGPGFLVTSNGITEAYRGYNFIFTNDTAMISKTAVPGLITAFVFLIIGVVFLALGAFLPFGGSTKFAGFLDIVGGICLLVTGILFILAKQLIVGSVTIPAVGATYKLGFGFLYGAIASFVAAVLACVAGFTGMKAKKA